MSEELLEISENEVLAEQGDVVVSLEREPDPNEIHEPPDNHVAEVIPVDFSAIRDLTDHMGETAFDGIPANTVLIYAPSNTAASETQVHRGTKLHSDASTANRTEVDFSTRSRAA